MAAGLAAFGLVLLADPSITRAVVLPLVFVGVAAYVIVTSRTRNGRLAGWLLLAATAAAASAWLLRELTWGAVPS